jgi:hypothetical protein
MGCHQVVPQAAWHPRVDDRRVLNGIFWVLRSGAGAICRKPMVPAPLAIIASFAGGRRLGPDHGHAGRRS